MQNEYFVPHYIVAEVEGMGYRVHTSMTANIKTWNSWYTGTTPFYKDEFVTLEGGGGTRDRLSIRPARRVCREWASLILNDGTIISCDDEEANTWLQRFIEEQAFVSSGQSFIEKTMALGTGAWALWFDVRGERTTIKVRRYDARMVMPLSWDVEGITECAFATQATVKGKRADQLTMHVFDEGTGTYHILTKLWLDGVKVDDPEKLGCIADFDTEIPVKPFGIVRPGIENTVEDLSPYGMSVFADAIDAIKATDLTFDALFQEIELTETKVFMSDEMIDVRDDKGKFIPIAKGKKSRMFRKLIGQAGKDLYEVFSPQMRIDPIREAFNVALSQLGDLCGFGQNYFVLDKAGGLKTATEVSSDNSALMRNIRKHEHCVGEAIKDVMTAAMLCAAVHCGEKIGNPGEIMVNWDDSIITDTQADKNMALAEIAALGIPRLKVEYLVKYFGMSEEDAEKAVPADLVIDAGF